MAGLETTDEMFDLRMSEGAKPLFEQVKAFIQKEVEPVTREFFQLGEGRADRWSWAPGQLELLDGVKAKAKAQGLWNFFLPDAETGDGPREPRLRVHRRRARQEPDRVGVPELLGARHRQHGGARAGRHAGAEEAVARAAAERRDPLRLRDDRARPRVVGREEHLVPRRARRRRVGDQRREVLHLRRRRSALQDHDRDGADEPGRTAAPAPVADPRADRRAGLRDPRSDARVRQGRRAARPHAPALRRTAACRRRTSCSARGAASRSRRCASGPAGSTTACARSAPRSARSS